MKSLAIWSLGIFGCAVMGALVGELIDDNSGAAAGALVGALLFLCMQFFGRTQQRPGL
jgi:hypothetical protein